MSATVISLTAAQCRTLGPPMDSEAERTVLAAVLAGQVGLAELGQLEAGHLTDPILRSAFLEIAQMSYADWPPLDELVERMRRHGITGPIGATLYELRECTPSYALSQVYEAAAQLVELHRRRRLLELLGRVAAEIRTGATDHAAACRELRRYMRMEAPT